MSYRSAGKNRILGADMVPNSNLMSRPAVRAIVLGGLIAGFCDFTYAVTYYALRGVPAIRIPQSIASGVLGSDSFKGGWKTAVLGVVLHFFTAFSAAAFYYAASRKLKLLLRWAPIAGMLYGSAIFFFMRRVVIPLSAVPHPKSQPHFVWSDFLVHVFLIGLPIALLTRHYQPLVQPSAPATRSVASGDYP
jgi:uncharacterized membrane protein YagU involved in acid resistance